jgi:hypothetical protein
MRITLEGVKPRKYAEKPIRPLTSEAAMLGLTPKERKRLERYRKRDCPTCEVGQTPWWRLQPFYRVEGEWIKSGFACKCQLRRL